MIKKILPLVLLCVFLLCGCVPEAASTGYAMDTYYNMSAYGENAEEALKKNSEILLDIENAVSATLVTSDVYKINSGEEDTAGGITRDMLELSINFDKATDGAFCAALKNLTDLWDIGGKNYLPTEDEIKNALFLCGMDKIEYKNGSIKTNGVKLDFGGIAKGYALDLMAENIRSFNCGALIDLGGSIAAVGKKQNGERYNVGISYEGGVCAKASIEDAFVSTSGIAERYFEQGGKRYHHIFDKNTGYPAENALYSVSVIADSGTFTDAMSTALFVMGEEKGFEFAQEEDIAAVFVYKDGSVIMTDAAKGYNVEITG